MPWKLSPRAAPSAPYCSGSSRWRSRLGIKRNSVHASHHPATARHSAPWRHLHSGISAFFGYSACSFLIDKYGRRPLYSSISSSAPFFTGELGSQRRLAVCRGRSGGGGVPSSIWRNGVVGELHPTRMRATALGWFFGVGRIGSFLAPTVVGSCGLRSGQWVLHTFALAYLMSARLLARRDRNKGQGP